MTLQKIKTHLFPKGFTLVELIVVITILAILGTIGFLSIGSYSSKARDSERTSDMVNLAKGMEILLSKGTTLPTPDANMITLTASGTPIGYQGYAGANTLRATGLGGKFQDPLTSTYYTYSTNIPGNKYQILGLLENGDNLSLSLNDIPGIATTYAGAYDTRHPLTKGSSLGILLGTGASLNQPVQELYNAASFTGVDLTKSTTSSGYVLIFSKNDTSTTGAGAYTGSLFTFAYNKRDDLIKDKNFALNDPSLVGYWDMETTVLSGSLLVLKDFSKYGNNGICYNSESIVNCGEGNGGPQFVSNSGKSGKAMIFDGLDDVIQVPTITDDLVFKKGNTVVLKGSTKIVGLNQNFLTKHWPFYMLVNTNSKFQNGTAVNITDSWQWLSSNSKVEANRNYIFVNRWDSDSKIFDQFLDQNYTSRTYNFSGSISSYALQPLYIGSDEPVYNRNYLNGYIDEIRIYSRVLSNSEIQALSQSMN